MVSLLSLFGGKKKQKSSAAGKPSTTGSQATPLNVGPVGHGPQRFLAARSRSSQKPYETASRHNGPHVVSKNGGSKQKAYQLPQLDLGLITGPDDFGPGSSGPVSALADVTSVPQLSDSERQAMDRLRFSAAEVAYGWGLLSAALRQRGYDDRRLLQPDLRRQDQRMQRYVLALLVLSIKPDLVGTFPTVAQRFSTGDGDASARSAWTQRLSLHMADLHAAQLTDSMLWLLHRLRPDSSNPAAELVPNETYASFVSAERATSYPHSAYDDHIRTVCHSDKTKLLDEVFDIMAAMVARADENGVTAQRASLLLGWWLLAMQETELQTGWSDLYDEWLHGGKRTQHLFLAWIRSQSQKSILPSRLEDLVRDYPFEIDALGIRTLLSSSAPRPTLCVRLITHDEIRRGREPCPRMLLSLSTDAMHKQDQSLLASIFGQDAARSDLANLLSEETLRFLRALDPEGDDEEYRNGHDAVSSRQSVTRPTEPAGDPPASAKSEARLPLRLSRSPDQHQSGLLRSPSQSSNWDDFSKSGFADDSNELKSKLSFTTTLSVSRPPSTDHVAETSAGHPQSKPKAVKPEIVDTPRIECKIEDERITTIDETFVSFVEDTLLDPAACSLPRPIFSIFRLAAPEALIHNGETTDIEFLLVSLEYQAPPAPLPPTSTPPAASPIDAIYQRPRPSIDSSSQTLTSSRKSFSIGLRDLSFGRRPSLGASAGSKRSMFGSIGRTRMSAPPERLQVLPEASAAATTVTVKSSQPRARAASLGPDQVIAEEVREPAKSSSTRIPVPLAPEMATSEPSESPAATTNPDEWKYLAEGGAHIVFAYVGANPVLRGKALRIRKSEKSSCVPQEVDRVWQDELLPKIVPADLLLRSETVDLPQEWLLRLMSQSQLARPEHRLFVESQKIGRASMMDNLQSLEGMAAGERVMAIEIKPKWGFMPDKQFIHPAEAVPIKSQIDRYTLHQALKRDQGKMATAYDPMDLYSGDEGRVQKALSDLWTAWRETKGRSNNWKVCVDGKAVHPEDADLIPTARGGALAEATAPLIRPLLSATSILDLLKNLQQQLDPTDISDLANRFRAEHPDRDIFDKDALPEAGEDELRSFIDLYISDRRAGKQVDAWTDRQRYIAWALSAIYKDCSIMLHCVVRPTSEDHYELVPDKSSVKLVDLDLKPVANLRKWYLLDEEIWQHWRDTHPPAGSNGPVVLADDERQVATAASTGEPEGMILLGQPLVHQAVSSPDRESLTPAASDPKRRPVEIGGAEEEGPSVGDDAPADHAADLSQAHEEETIRTSRPDFLQLSQSEPVIPVVSSDAAAEPHLDPPHIVAPDEDGPSGAVPFEPRNPVIDNLIRSDHLRPLESTPDLVSDHSSVASYFDASENAHSAPKPEDIDEALSDAAAAGNPPGHEATARGHGSDAHADSAAAADPVAFQLAAPIAMEQSRASGSGPEESNCTSASGPGPQAESAPDAQPVQGPADAAVSDGIETNLSAVLNAAGPATAAGPPHEVDSGISPVETITEPPPAVTQV